LERPSFFAKLELQKVQKRVRMSLLLTSRSDTRNNSIKLRKTSSRWYTVAHLKNKGKNSISVAFSEETSQKSRILAFSAAEYHPQGIYSSLHM